MIYLKLRLKHNQKLLFVLVVTSVVDEGRFRVDSFKTVTNIWRDDINASFDGMKNYLMEREQTRREKLFLCETNIYRFHVPYPCANRFDWNMMNERHSISSFDVYKFSKLEIGIEMISKVVKEWKSDRDGNRNVIFNKRFSLMMAEKWKQNGSPHGCQLRIICNFMLSKCLYNMSWLHALFKQTVQMNSKNFPNFNFQMNAMRIRGPRMEVQIWRMENVYVESNNRVNK